MAALAALALGACGDDSGLLIEIARDDSVPAALDRLVIYVGTDVAGRDGGGFAEQAPDQDVALGGRDLLGDPYRLLLAPTAGSAAQHVMVAALVFKADAVVGFGALAEPVTFIEGQLARWPLVVTASLPDGFAIDEGGCLRWFDADGTPVVIGRPPDRDCDGYADDDCDDLDPAVNPGAIDVCGSGVDEDCDDQIDEDVDEDGDSFTTCGGDCDDRTALVNPDADEACDGLDNDCDGGCDVEFDADGDQFTPCGSKLKDDGRCEKDPSFADCDDEDEEVRPFAAEVCDGIDNDCSGACDDGDGLDPDGDSYTACGSIVGICHLEDGAIDCEPDNEAVHPGAAELCNGVDDDCDGAFLETAPCFGTAGDGCYLGERPCDEPGLGGFSDACQAEATDELAARPELCTAYAACDAAGDGDPYACAIGDATAASLGCVVGFTPADDQQCPENIAALPTGGSLTCTWSVVGGIDQGDYFIGFVAADGAGEIVATGACDAALGVELLVSRPAPVAAVLERTDEGVTVSVQLIVTPLPAATCPPPAGLACTLAGV